MNIFDGVTTNWGFDASDVWSNGMNIVGSLAPFVLLGLAIALAPRAISLIKGAVASRGGKKS